MTRRKPVGKSRTARGATTPPARSRVQASPHTALPPTVPPSDAPPTPTPDSPTFSPVAPHGQQEEGRQEERLPSDTPSDTPSEDVPTELLTAPLTDPEALALACEGAIRVEDAPWAPPRVRNQLPARVIRFTIRHALCWDGTWWQHGDVWPLDLVLSCDERKLRQLVETGFLHVEVLHRGVPPELLAPPTEDA